MSLYGRGLLIDSTMEVSDQLETVNYIMLFVLIEMLITDFILEETSDGSQSTDDASCGEVYVEVDAYPHPATGELEGQIRGTLLYMEM